MSKKVLVAGVGTALGFLMTSWLAHWLIPELNWRVRIQHPLDRNDEDRERADRLEDRGEARNRTAAEVVAVGEAARQHDQLAALEGVVLVPEEGGLLAEHVLEDVIDVVVAVAAWKNNDPEFHL